MDFLFDLWLPIVVSAVLVFITSSIFHMALPIHKSDYRKVGDEAAFLAAVRAAGVGPGHYMFPMCSSMKDMNSPEMAEKYRQGPVGFMTILPSGPVALGKSLATWFIFCLIVGVFTAYVTGLALAPGAEYLMVFRIGGAVATLGYALTHFVDSVWKGMAWSITSKFIGEGIVYGLLTAGVFAWLWPGV